MNEPNKCIFCGTKRAVMVPVEGGYYEETEKKWDSVLAIYVFPNGDNPTAIFTICPSCRKNKIEALYGKLTDEMYNETQAVAEKIKKGVKEW